MRPLTGLLRRILPAEPLSPATVEIEDRSLPVSFKRNARAKRLIVRLDRSGEGIVVTVPPRARRAEALDFVHRSRGWIAEQIRKRPQGASLAPGGSVLLRGITTAIRLVPERRGLVRQDVTAAAVLIPGDAAHAPRRLRDWLMAEAKRDLSSASARYAAAMDVRYRRLSVRDQKSRWGSCSSDGSLSYSWRLIMAPPFVLDYVAAHEVAHLRHMNHGRAYWRLVLSHCPDAARARTWLKRHGGEMHRYSV